MLFKLSIRNMKRSVQNYMIYFLTLVLGVSIFYVFNSLNSQQVMDIMTNSQKEVMKMLVTSLNIVSIGISVVLGLLIIYANQFLIRRRKKEFGVYLTLGMGKQSISKILFGETFIIGCVSLVVGLFIGIFASQFTSGLVVKMFDLDMSKYKFSFSKTATTKTILYFGIMYILVIVLNVINISRIQLIDLLNAAKKNEKMKIKNPLIAVFLFVLSVSVLSYCYYQVTVNYLDFNLKKTAVVLVLGCIGTIMLFWSLSGFLLKVVQKNKRLYFRGLNTFVLRQVDSKINTTVISMSVICLMLFSTICILSSGLSINKMINKQFATDSPCDVCIFEECSGDANDEVKISDKLSKNGLKKQVFRNDMVEGVVYSVKGYTLKSTIGQYEDEVHEVYPILPFDQQEEFVSVSEYNKVAALYGEETYELKDDEFVLISTFASIKDARNKALMNKMNIAIDDKVYHSKYAECRSGRIEMSLKDYTLGIYIMPDQALKTSKDAKVSKKFLVSHYASSDKSLQRQIDDQLMEIAKKKEFKNTDIVTKILISANMTGIVAIITFVAIYIGVIFLITSATLLALKELSECAENKIRYEVLRKIGTDEQMLDKALFQQMFLFFGIPLFVAVIHAVFGINFCNKSIVEGMGESNLDSIILTAIIILVIYGLYFISTFFVCRQIVHERK